MLSKAVGSFASLWATLTDEDIKLKRESLSALQAACNLIGVNLDVVSEFGALRTHSPNSVVYSKAVLSFVHQLDRLADLYRQHMLVTPPPERSTL